MTIVAASVIAVAALASFAQGQDSIGESAVQLLGPRTQSVEQAQETLPFMAGGPEKWTSPQGLASSLQIMLLLTVLSLAPAVLLMTTI